MVWRLIGLRLIAIPVLTGLCISPVSAADSTATVEIQGSTRLGERYEARFAAFVANRPVRDDVASYSPRINTQDGPLTAKWFPPLRYHWDFGDGTRVTMDERSSVSHRYRDDGDYTVTVTASDEDGEIASASHQVSVFNNNPQIMMAAVELDRDRSLFEFTANAFDVPGDELTYHWDFGDGETASGLDLNWALHEYAGPGTYEVTLTVTDDDHDPQNSDGGRTDGKSERARTIQVVAADSGTSPGVEPIGEQPPLESVVTGLTGSLSGALSAELDAEVRSFRGLYLSQVASGACRFMYTAWDDTNLAHLHAVVDLRGVPAEGARFRIPRPQLTLVLEDSVEDYARQKSAAMGPLGESGLGGLAAETIESEIQNRSENISETKRQSIRQLFESASGIDPTPRDEGQPPQSAGVPLVEQQARFVTTGGQLELDFMPGDRAIGRYDVNLTSNYEPMKGESVSIQAELALDLVAARRDGVVRYEGCEPPLFDILSSWPDDGMEHLSVDRSWVRVRFTDSVDPETINEQTFQLAYTDTSETLVPVAGRLMRSDRAAYFFPQQPLMSGVQYTARIKTGEEGILSRAAQTLEDSAADDESWHSWRFTTRVNLIPDNSGSQLLACHLFQTTRDVPLIVGKPGIARVYANWERQPQVHKDHQVQSFNAEVLLTDTGNRTLGSSWMEFIRPTLYSARNVDRRRAEHTAQIPFEPTADLSAPEVRLMVRQLPSTDPVPFYRAQCPGKLWDRAPQLSIDFRALQIGYWAEDSGHFNDTIMPILQSLADESVELAWQLYPFAEIRGSQVQVLTGHGITACRCPAADEPHSPASGCSPAACQGEHMKGIFRFTDDQMGVDEWFSAWGAGYLVGQDPSYAGIRQRLVDGSDADVVVAIGPHWLLEGGGTGALLADGRGAVVAFASDQGQHFSRYLFGLVHELGHVLGLEHLPETRSDADRQGFKQVRDGGENQAPFHYKGIEGLLMDRTGQFWWNKSSTEGNEQSDRLFPLMAPATVTAETIFIADHHYRSIQKLLDRLDW